MASLLDCRANAILFHIVLQHCTMENVCFGQQIRPTFDSSVQNHETGLKIYSVPAVETVEMLKKCP